MHIKSIMKSNSLSIISLFKEGALSKLFCNPLPVFTLLATMLIQTCQEGYADSMTFTTDTAITEDAAITAGEIWRINPGVTLTIASGVTIIIEEGGIMESFVDPEFGPAGTINNFGTIETENGASIQHSGGGEFNNFSLIDNHGTIELDESSGMKNTGGTINNFGLIDTFFFDRITNSGIINNSGSINISPFSDLKNSGTINNDGVIDDIFEIENTGTIFNSCAGVLIGTLRSSENPIVQEEPCEPIANDLPLARDDSYVVAVNSGTTILSPAVTTNDDFGDDGPVAMAIVIASCPNNGLATVNDGGTPDNPVDDSIDYTPDQDFIGTDSVSYTIEDSNGDVSTATMTITVSSILVDNPSIETNTKGWSAYNGATIQRVMDGLNGDFSLEITGPRPVFGKFGINDSPNRVEATPAVGTRYRFSAWVKSDTSSGSAQLRVREYKDRTKVGATTLSPGVILSPTWQLITVEHISEAAGSTLDFQVLYDPAKPNETFLVDNISIFIPIKENLVDNPSFETGINGWNAYNGATIQRVMDGLDGDFSLEVSSPESISGKFGINDSPNWVEPTPATRTRYRFSAWVKSNTQTLGRAQLRVREYKDRTRVGSSILSDEVKLSSTWQQITVEHVSEAAGSTLDFQVLYDARRPGEAFLIDNISISNPRNENIIRNPCFDTDTSDWHSYNSASIERVMEGVNGDYSLEVTGPASITAFGVNDLPNRVQSTLAAGTKYRISARVKSDTSSGLAQR